MNPRLIRQFKFLLVVSDMLMIYATFIVVRALFSAANMGISEKVYDQAGACFSITWLIISMVTNHYKSRFIASMKEYFKSSLNGLVYFFFIGLIFLLMVPHILIARLVFAVALSCTPVILSISRVFYLFLYDYYKKKSISEKVVVIGYNDLSKRLIRSLEENSVNKEIIGICDEMDNVKELHHYPILSNIDNAFDVCKVYGATEIYSSIAPEHNPNIYKLIQQADEHCIHFHIIPDTSVFVNKQCYFNYVNGIPIISMRHEPLEEFSKRMIKDTFDVVFSFFIVMLVLSWLIPVVALLIKLDSKGPVFFRQVRSGKGNKKFVCLKFRSMKVNNSAHEIQATKNDQRFTRLGKFLRRTNLDEFPQFFNVLKGDMSIVGPRPHMLKHTQEYSKMMDQYMVRHFLKPGITGWAQVNGYRGEINSFDKLKYRVEHDIWYLENWSLWLDIKIIFLTVLNAIRGQENAF